MIIDYIIDKTNFIKHRIIFDKGIFIDLNNKKKCRLEKIIRKCFNSYLGNFAIFSNNIYFSELSLDDNYKENIKSWSINPNHNLYKKMIENQELFKKSLKRKLLKNIYQKDSIN